MQIDRHLCGCGCGLETNIATRNRNRPGWVKGHHLKYIVGHSSRRPVRIGPKGTVWCGECRRFKRKTSFATCARKKNKLQGTCKRCNSKIGKRYRNQHRDHLRNLSRISNLKKKFGITVDAYNVLYLSQNGLCAICGKPERTTYKGQTRRLAVDHSHSSGKIRALLCTGCNAGIGDFNESVPVLKAAISYLRKHGSFSQ